MLELIPKWKNKEKLSCNLTAHKTNWLSKMALVKVAVSSFFDILRENFCEKATNTLRSGQVMTKHFEKPKNMIF